MKTLADWTEFAGRQVAAIEARLVSRSAVHRAPTDPDLVGDWLIAESALVSAAVEQSVQVFVATRQWPGLEDELAFFLLFRLNAAAGALDLWTIHDGAVPYLPSPPDYADEEAFILWMYVDIWKAFGAVYLRAWAATLVDKHRRGVLPPFVTVAREEPQA